MPHDALNLDRPAVDDSPVDVVDSVLSQRATASAQQVDVSLLRKSLDTQKTQAAQLLQLMQPIETPPPSIDRGRGLSIDLYA